MRRFLFLSLLLPACFAPTAEWSEPAHRQPEPYDAGSDARVDLDAGTTGTPVDAGQTCTTDECEFESCRTACNETLDADAGALASCFYNCTAHYRPDAGESCRAGCATECDAQFPGATARDPDLRACTIACIIFCPSDE